MTCDDVRMSLGVYALGALDADETAEVEAHLDGCPACRAELAELSGLPGLLARVSEEDIEHASRPPGAVLDRMLAASAKRHRRSRTLLLIAASVVVTALGGTTWLASIQTSGQETASAARPPAAAQQEAREGAKDSARDLTTESAQSGGEGSDAATLSDQGADQGQGADQAPDLAADQAGDPAASSRPSPDAVAKVRPQPAPQDFAAQSGDVKLGVRLVAQEGGTKVEATVSGVPAGTRCRLLAIGRDGSVAPVAGWKVTPEEYRRGAASFDGSTEFAVAEIQRLELTTSSGRTLVTIPL